MLGRLNYYLWYFFFSAYWTASDLGEKHKPESNATNYISFTIALNLFFPFHIALLMGYKISGLILFICCFLPGLIIPYVLFRRVNVFPIKFKQFEFLKRKEFKRRRYMLLIIITAWSIMSFIGIGILRILH